MDLGLKVSITGLTKIYASVCEIYSSVFQGYANVNRYLYYEKGQHMIYSLHYGLFIYVYNFYFSVKKLDVYSRHLINKIKCLDI